MTVTAAVSLDDPLLELFFIESILKMPLGSFDANRSPALIRETVGYLRLITCHMAGQSLRQPDCSGHSKGMTGSGCSPDRSLSTVFSSTVLQTTWAASLPLELYAIVAPLPIYGITPLSEDA